MQCACVLYLYTWHSTSVEVRRQLMGVSFFPSNMCNPGIELRSWQAPSPCELSHQPNLNVF